MLVLELLGTLCLRGDTGPVPLAAQQKRRLGLLAILGLGGKQGLSRDRIEAYLYPESADERARHALDQAVYAIRHALGSEFILSTGRELRLNPELVRVDLWDFEDAIRARDFTAAAGFYKGTLLDGFHFADSRELESWIDTERARLRLEYQTAVEFLANRSADAGDYSQSITWWRRLANSDPLSAGATKKLMLALVAAGDRAGAVKHARLYQELVRQELEMEPDSEIEKLATTLSNHATNGTVTARVRGELPAPASSPSSDTPGPSAMQGESSEINLPRHPLGKPFRSKRSRIAAVLSFSLLMVLLIGAVAVENRQRRDRHPSLGENGAGRGSRITLPGARDAYVQGLNAWSDGSKKGLDTAVADFRRATELDPQYAEAYAGLADAYVMQGYFGYRPGEEVFPKAKAAALRSMQLDSALPSAHPALAYELTWERDFVRADSEFHKAVALDPTYTTAKEIAADPTYAMAHQWYAILLMILGHRPEAVVASSRARNLNPFSLTVPVVELTFTKWVTTYPALTGYTSYGAGSLAGQVLNRIDDGVSTHISARYEITDPGGTRSFKAVIQGKGDDKTGSYDLNGIVTWGWMIGAHVHATFLRITPCQLAKLNVCFRGTIQIQRGSA
jgi:DNA-binding SARP family transcriptional activator